LAPINLFAIGLVGEYVAKIMEEVKGRPRLIRAALIKDGETTQLLPEPPRVTSVFDRMETRACPVCGAGPDLTTVFLDASFDPTKLTAASFASRKTPEFMSYRLLRCMGCEDRLRRRRTAGGDARPGLMPQRSTTAARKPRWQRTPMQPLWRRR